MNSDYRAIASSWDTLMLRIKFSVNTNELISPQQSHVSNKIHFPHFIHGEKGDKRGIDSYINLANLS